MTNLTAEHEAKLQMLWDRYKEVSDNFSYSDWCSGDVQRGRKMAKTLRFNKYYNYAKSLGYDMVSSMPKQMTS